ncbi:unnamed protein product, partial [Ectocarpus sp. 12 AP-2014]
RNKYGIKSDVVRSVYLGAVEPMITYGAQFWSGITSRRWGINALRHIQRPFLIRMCKAYRRTSSDALCILARVKPIHLQVNQIAAICLSKQSRQFVVNGQIYPVQRPIQSNLHPSISSKKFVLPALSTTIPSLSATSHCMAYSIYTDGSRSENGVGCAFVVYFQECEIYNQVFQLPEYSSVFQSELMALSKALEFVAANTSINPVHLFTDSQSSLMAIEDPLNGMPLVVGIQTTLNTLHQSERPVSLSWVRAHVG